MRINTLYHRIGYSDGFLILKLSEVDYSKDIASKNILFFKWFHKHLRTDLTFNSGTLILNQYSIANKKRQAKIQVQNIEKRRQFFVMVSWNRVSSVLFLLHNIPSFSVANTENYEVHIGDDGSLLFIDSSFGTYFQFIANDKDPIKDKVVDESYPINGWKNNLIEIFTLLYEAKKIKNHIARLEIHKRCLSKLVKGMEIYFKKKFIELGYL